MRLVPREACPDFLDLPWELPLTKWSSDRIVEAERGIGRHVVRFVDYGSLYALKELPPDLAAREYRLLRRLGQAGLPSVDAAGIVTDRDGELADVLITRYLDFSLPFRLVLRRRILPGQWDPLLDAFAELPVRLHLAGLLRGACPLAHA